MEQEEEKLELDEGPPKKKIAAGDFIFGSLLILFSVYIMYSALNMKVYKTILDAPGLFPFVLGLIIGILGLFLVTSAVKRGAKEQLKEMVKAEYFINVIKSFGFQRVSILVVLMMFYMFVLVGRVHFVLATFIYLVSTFIYLKSANLIKSIIIAAVFSVIISYAFRAYFGIPLP